MSDPIQALTNRTGCVKLGGLCKRRAEQVLNELLWGRVLIVALLAIGMVFSARTRWVQLRYFGAMFGLLGSAFHKEGNHLSSFQALVLSVIGPDGSLAFCRTTKIGVDKIWRNPAKSHRHVCGYRLPGML